MNDTNPLIMNKTLESLQDNIEIIRKFWDLPYHSTVDDEYHSDVHVLANSRLCFPLVNCENGQRMRRFKDEDKINSAFVVYSKCI